MDLSEEISTFSKSDRKIPIECGIRYLSYVRQLESRLNEENLPVDIIFDNYHKVYLALIAVGPDAPERFSGLSSLSQTIGSLDHIAANCGLKLNVTRENYSEGVDEYSAELLLRE